MRSTLIKLLIALLPTAPVAGDYLSEVEQNNDSSNESDTTMESVIEDHDSEYPMIHNVGETNIQVGDSFDPLEGVYAVDKTSEVTDNITTSGEVDTNTPGDYYVDYKVTGTDGSWYEITRVVHVTDAETDEVPPVPKRDDDSKSRVTFLNVKDQTISQNSDFDPTKDIQIIDTDGNDITKDVHVTGDKVDPSKTGTYYIAYTVLDRFGEPNAKAVKVSVE